MKAGLEKVLVRRSVKETVTKEGIIIPETTKEKVVWGEVIDFSPSGKLGMRMGPGASVCYRADCAIRVKEEVGEVIDSIDEKDILAWDRVAVGTANISEAVVTEDQNGEG